MIVNLVLLHINSPPPKQPSTVVRPAISARSSANGSGQFRRRREKSTMILVTIVGLFLLCHSYRLALKVYELAYPEAHTMSTFMYCNNMGR